MTNNKLLVSGASKALEQMKWEIANEHGVQLDGETTSRLCGVVGGEMVKRLCGIAEQILASK